MNVKLSWMEYVNKYVSTTVLMNVKPFIMLWIEVTLFIVKGETNVN